ncbi:MAG TPA: hypothetical protein PK885_11220, partial [Candidatus Marinimicrobia bacterium]|nr:hypothetical protein [Candidatus Neomarinimicrobiota bacterium]
MILVSQAVELQPLYKKQAKKPVLRFGDVELVGIEPATFPTNRDALPLLTGISQAGSPDQLILVSQAVELQPLYKKQAKKPVLRFGDVELVG